MGPFDFQIYVPPEIDLSNLEMRPAIMIEDEVIYEGEWRKGSDVREGKGL